MNILLLNTNPVVKKLVTLSVTKIGATISSLDTLENLEQNRYDLLIVDDEFYFDELFHILEDKVVYKKSLYIHAKNTSFLDGFDYELKKPFLPTDLVELLTKISSNLSINETKEIAEDDISLDINEDLKPLSELPTLDEQQSDVDSDTVENDTIPSILDEEDVQEVQQLLEDTDSKKDKSVIEDLDILDDDSLKIEEIPTEDILDLSDIEEESSQNKEKLPKTEEIVSKEDELSAEVISDIEEESPKAEELKAEELLEIEPQLEKIVPKAEEKLSLETEDVVSKMSDMQDVQQIDTDALIDDIQNKIEEEETKLSDEELNTEITDDLLDGADRYLDELSDLDEDALKVAVGEESNMTQQEKDDIHEEGEGDESIKSHEEDEDKTKQPQEKSGVQALKALLKALDDEDIIASLDGMNINISISIGKN